MIPFTGRPSSSRNRAQKSVAPPALTIAARITFGPFFNSSRGDTPSSITVWRSLKRPITSLPLTHQMEAAFDPIDRRTPLRSRGASTMVTAQKSTFEVGLFSAYAKWKRLTL